MAKITLKRIGHKDTVPLNNEPEIVIPDEILTRGELVKNKLGRVKLDSNEKLRKQDILKLLDSGTKLLTNAISCYKDITLQKEKTKIERLNAEARVGEAKEKTKQIVVQETEQTRREISKYEELKAARLNELEKCKIELQNKKENRRILENVLNTLLKNFDSLLSEKALILQKIHEDDILFERYKTRLNEIDANITKSQQDIIKLITNE